MKSNIIKLICAVGLLALASCHNSDIEFPDYEGGTTVYFPYQYPVRTIRLCPDEGDTKLDLEHKCQILATFGGSYNGSNGTVQVAVDNTLCNNLFFEDGVSPVKAMPAEYYQLSTTSLDFNGTMNGRTTVTLTDAFFKDPDAVKVTYVIPLVMTSQTGFGKILSGTALEGQSGSRCDESIWEVKPMDYILYCVKFQNKYSGWWLTNHSLSTDDIEKAQTVEIKSKSLDECIYTVSYQDNDQILTADLLLSFSGDNCKISSLTPGVTASGSGSWAENSEKKAWGDKDRNGMELQYSVTFGDKTYSEHEKLVWQRSGLKPVEEFSPIYVK